MVWRQTWQILPSYAKSNRFGAKIALLRRSQCCLHHIVEEFYLRFSNCRIRRECLMRQLCVIETAKGLSTCEIENKPGPTTLNTGRV
jgi:hypothetical protein